MYFKVQIRVIISFGMHECRNDLSCIDKLDFVSSDKFLLKLNKTDIFVISYEQKKRARSIIPSLAFPLYIRLVSLESSILAKNKLNFFDFGQVVEE